MNRLGFTAQTLPKALDILRQLPVDITLMTHFAEADGERGVAWQMERFRAMAGDWSGPVSLGNSAAILRHPEAHGDWVRPGIMLYGASRSPSSRLRIRFAVGDDPGKRHHRRAGTGARRTGRLWRHFYGGAADAHRRRRLRLCRRLPAPRADRHADRGDGATHPHGRAGVDGHAGLRPDRHSRGRYRRAGDLVGEWAGRRGAGR